MESLKQQLTEREEQLVEEKKNKASVEATLKDTEEKLAQVFRQNFVRNFRSKLIAQEQELKRGIDMELMRSNEEIEELKNKVIEVKAELEYYQMTNVDKE